MGIKPIILSFFFFYKPLVHIKYEVQGWSPILWKYIFQIEKVWKGNANLTKDLSEEERLKTTTVPFLKKRQYDYNVHWCTLRYRYWHPRMRYLRAKNTVYRWSQHKMQYVTVLSLRCFEYLHYLASLQSCTYTFLSDAEFYRSAAIRFAVLAVQGGNSISTFEPISPVCFKIIFFYTTW